MRKIRSFFRFGDKKLFFIALAMAFWQYLWGRRIPYGKHAETGQLPVFPALPEDGIRYVLAVRRVLKLVRKYFPLPFKCRHEARLAGWLLRQEKINYFTCIGFKEEQGVLQGHAWTVSGGIMVCGFCNPKEYMVTNCFTG
ncbi:MAG: hypothetical protein RI973_94 [Bacteroidota bacterium]|jgi:hypothetical protein